MTGIVVACHAHLASELIQAAEMIIGPSDQIVAIAIEREMSVDQARTLMQKSIEQVASGNEGVIILTDLFGGTPTNIASEFLAGGGVEILSGVNLPMLLKCLSARRGATVSDLAGMLKDYARHSIMRPTELLG